MNIFRYRMIDILRIAYYGGFRVLLIMNYSRVTEWVKECCQENGIEIELVPECGCNMPKCVCTKEELENYQMQLFDRVLSADIVVSRRFRGKIDLGKKVKFHGERFGLVWRLMSPEAAGMLSDFTGIHRRLSNKYFLLQELAGVIAMLDLETEAPVIDIEHMMLACMLAGVEFIYTDQEKQRMKEEA